MASSEFDDDKTQSFVALTAGTKVSHYEIISKIGAGGMGEVYLAEDTQLDRKVALKFLSVHLSQDESSRIRFTREAKAAAKLDHPNIVPVFEVGEYQGRPFFAMAHIEGKSLRQVIKEGKLTVEESIRLTSQICEGMHKAHESGVVHRDIKPGNIIIDNEHRPRILDFGLATLSGEEKLTKTGSTLGTVGYMSPEQIEGKQVDHRSDIFSLGVILYEMLTGHRPFEGDNDAAVSRSITDTTPEPVARYKSGVSGELQQIVDKALSKDPSLRYQHSDSMIVDLRRCFVGENLESTEKNYKPSIAVLPFVNLSGDPSLEYFGDGIAEEIIHTLSQIETLHVVARTSCFSFKGKNEDIRNIGNKLKAKSVLEGSFRIAGDSVRVTAQLINVSNGYHIWSEKYDRRLQNIFEVQDDISLVIVNQLKGKLLASEKKKIIHDYARNFNAYNLYLKAKFLWNKRTTSNIYEAIELFNQVITIDRGYAPAYAGLASCYVVLPQYAMVPGNEMYKKARKYALIAMEKDDSLAEARVVLASVLLHLDWDWAKAKKEFQLAIELNRGYPTSYHWYSQCFVDLGCPDQAVEEIEKALELDPLSPIINLAVADAYTYADMASKGEAICYRIMESHPHFATLIHYILSNIFKLRGEHAAAMKERLQGPYTQLLAKDDINNLMRLNESENKQVVTKALIEMLLLKAKEIYIPPCEIAELYFELGDLPKAKIWMEKGLAVYDRNVVFLFKKFFTQICSDPQFESIMTSLNKI